jgi:hypothetical protein
VHGAHLIGDRTNAADPRDDIRNFGQVAASQKCLEQARRLEDLQFDVRHLVAFELDEKPAFAFDSREIGNLDGADPGRCLAHDCSHSSLALRNCHAQALNPRNARLICWSLCPRIRNWLLSDSVFGLSIGP